ncbi:PLASMODESMATA CALLOSE-BINDING PROTEIN 3-like [Andrographis paniculata]|uniref:PLASMODESMATA CALLOSE-BINDING PROTEIN 3-like n=1 Tax=Andrographis paniculata TaxID=175694 RepID=UPI0021E848D2|nr:PLASMODESMATA CALLOSE-BINDING PROTEIN 3-like [Andrographis paniculata]
MAMGAGFVVSLVVLMAMADHSNGAYCVCNSGVNDSALQKNIDYACGNGADCSAILQNGACYNPNTVKDHCNYAVNSYYQKKSQVSGSCDFVGTATVTQTPPSAASGCVYPSSPSGGTTSPGTGTGGGGGGLTPGSSTLTPPGIAFAPGSGGGGFTDNSGGSMETLLPQTANTLFVLLSFSLTYALICPTL